MLRFAVVVVVLLAVALVAVYRLLGAGSVPDRLQANARAGTGHGTDATDLAPTGGPADAGAEDQFVFAGDAAPAPPSPSRPSPSQPARAPSPRGPVPASDPDAPGTSVADPSSGDAVEPNEPA